MTTSTESWGDLVGSIGLGRMTEARHSSRAPLPSREAVKELVDQAKIILFPTLHGVGFGSLGEELSAVASRFLEELATQVRRSFAAFSLGADHDEPLLDRRSAEVTRTFARGLPILRDRLVSDVQAALEGDPAFHSENEVILCYPGIQAVLCYRLAHSLYVLEVPILPRMITAWAHSTTGIDIHPGAQIGESFFIDHGTGVVIGETAVIGNRVRIYHGVTLGAKSFPTDGEGKVIRGVPRHPILEDEVVVYSCASILGRVTVGRRSVVGGNVWLTRDVPPDSRVLQAEVRQTLYAGGEGI